MSGPIIRKYGFPNFEKIFGDRELKHGVDPDAPKADVASTSPELPAAEPSNESAPPPSPSEPPEHPTE